MLDDRICIMKYSDQKEKDIDLHWINHYVFQRKHIRTPELAYILTIPEEQELKWTTLVREGIHRGHMTD